MQIYKVYTLENGIVETDNYGDFSELTLHREDGPAKISYYNNGKVSLEEYWCNNKKHRLDGPAYINYDRNGIVRYVEYWLFNKKHRLGGPSDIIYNDNNIIIAEAYWINNICYYKDQYYKELLKLKVQSL